VVEVLPGPVETDMLAGSARMPEAADYDGYGAMAQAVFDGRAAISDMTTPAAAAAATIREAILADGGPLRWACDPLGGQLLAAWQTDPEGTIGVR